MVREREGERGGERERGRAREREGERHKGITGLGAEWRGAPSGHVQDDQRPRLHRRENKEYRVQSRKAEKRTLIS